VFEIFLFVYSFWLYYNPGVDSASNRNEYEGSSLGSKGGTCVGLIILPPALADCLKILRAHLPGDLEAYLGQYRESFTFTF
jgi:hypothetical protein